MALTKDQKEKIVSDLSELFNSSKITVVANYQGTTVKQFQDLRHQAKEGTTTIKVVKNRLVKKALDSGNLKDVDTSKLTDQLLYAFDSEDEVAPAQILAKFNKSAGTIDFVGAITSDGNFMEADDVKVLANLPNKEQLRGQLVGTIAAPLSGFVNVLSGNVRSVLTVLNARAEAIK